MIPYEFSKYIKSKEFQDLLASYEQALADNTSVFIDAQDILDIAEYYHVTGNDDAANKAAQYCLDMYPGDFRAKVFIARNAIANGDIKTAVKIAAELNPESYELDIIYLFAEIAIAKGDTDKSEIILQNAFEMFEEDSDERLDMALDVPMLYCDYKEWELAEKWLSTPEAESQKDEIDYIESKAIICTANKEYEEAVEAWNKYIDIDAFSANAWLQLAQNQYQLGLAQEALDSAQYAITLAPEQPDPYLAAGNAQFSLGKSEEALESFKKFVSIVPNDPQGEMLISCVYFTIEKYDEAKTHIEKAIEGLDKLERDDIPEIAYQEIFRQAALICSAQGDIDQATKYFDKLLDHGMSEDNILLLRVAILLEAGKSTEAMEILRDIFAEGTLEPETYLQIGIMFVDSSYFDIGFGLLYRTITIINNSGMECPLGHDRLAYAALATGHYDVFLTALENSIKYLPAETVTIFSTVFPEEMPITEYLDYAKTHKLRIK